MADPIGYRWIGSTSGNMEASRSSASGPDQSDAAPPSRGRAIHDAADDTPPSATRDDRAIVDAVLAGDREAYRHLVERESAAVVRACHRILGDLHEAEDAAQEAFVTAYRSLAGWRGEGPFGAWLTRIAVRIALRQAGRRRSVTWIDPTGSEAAEGAPGTVGSGTLASPTLVTGPNADPALAALRSERASELRVAVAALPEPYREIVTLRFFGDLSLDEIARQTDRPVPTVKTQLRRGLLRLRTSVDQGGAA
jgi:RNA polymerase sigma-70 factor, ECF subfamily